MTDPTSTPAISQTIERVFDAWNRHDAHAFAMAFTEDADFTLHGRANVEAFHAPRFATYFSESRLTGAVRSIRFLTDELAAVDIDWEMTGAKSPDGKPWPQRKGLLNWIMSRQSDGTWLVEVMHNTDFTNILPPAKAKSPI